MLLKLIKTRQVISGAHCELWEINHLSGNRLLANVFVLNEHLPAELIYPLIVTFHGLRIRGQDTGWQWESAKAELSVTGYLRGVQEIREEIYIEVCIPEPYLPGYPHVDRNPDDFPVVLGDFE